MTAENPLEKPVVLELTAIEVLAIHGNLALALRHPENRGVSRSMMLRILEELTRILLHEGVLTHKLLEQMQHDEIDHGSADLAQIYWRLC